MAKKKQLDNLSLDMIQCKKDGFGCHYGAWKATQDRTVVIEKEEVPEGWKVCTFCGRHFKPNKYGNGRQVYCDVYCQKAALAQRRRKKNSDRQARYRERKKTQNKVPSEAERNENIDRVNLWIENRKKVQCG